jgi:hypothetical protein
LSGSKLGVQQYTITLKPTVLSKPIRFQMIVAQGNVQSTFGMGKGQVVLEHIVGSHDKGIDKLGLVLDGSFGVQ